MSNKIKVNSSVIKELSYRNGMLTVYFTNGRIYVYNGVPEKVYRELVNANSVGKYFRTYIAENYVFTQI